MVPGDRMIATGKIVGTPALFNREPVMKTITQYGDFALARQTGDERSRANPRHVRTCVSRFLYPERRLPCPRRLRRVLVAFGARWPKTQARTPTFRARRLTIRARQRSFRARRPIGRPGRQPKLPPRLVKNFSGIFRYFFSLLPNILRRFLQTGGL